MPRGMQGTLHILWLHAAHPIIQALHRAAGWLTLRPLMPHNSSAPTNYAST